METAPESVALCACGCGEEPGPGKRFVHGHWSRTPEARALFEQRRKPHVPLNPSGLCLCGCGQKTDLSQHNHPERGYRVGEPMLYMDGHAQRLARGEKASGWKGGRWKHRSGYIQVYAPDHPDASMQGYVAEHRLIMERQLGRRLTDREHVHHINGVKDDNRAENLVVLLHEDHARQHAAQALNRYYETHDRREVASKGGIAGAAARWGTKPA